MVKGKEIKLPDFLVAGAAKSGTTSLYHYLKQHPQIFMPENKEPWFFTFDNVKEDEMLRRKNNIITDFNKYINLFKDAGDLQLSGDASTIYLYLHDVTIKNIKKYYPDWRYLKIIIILRNPIERAFSHYLNLASTGVIKFSFEELIKKWNLKQLPKYNNVIDYGFYYNQIKNYRENFDQVKILLYEDIKANNGQCIRALYSFLGVDSSFCPDTSIMHNVSVNPSNHFLTKILYKPNLIKSITKKVFPKKIKLKIKNKILKAISKKPAISGESIKYLIELYSDEILRLQALLNRDLTQWLK